MGRLYRDRYGVPHVRADDVLDLARTQGYAAARDRTWQLEHQRRRATGTAAELLGRPQLAWDVFARRVRIVETAQRAYAAMAPESRAFVAAYVEGVNQGLDQDAPELRRLGARAERWEPWTPLAVFRAQHVLFASLPGKLWHALLREVLGPEEALLSRDPAYASGSNAWAVGGARTASGRPLIGGDPHRGFEHPGVYAQVRLAVEDEGIDVVGFTFPGVPGVQHFAQAREVAWAITNAAADYHDVYAESLDDVVETRTETVAVRGADPVEVEVATTARGPLFELDRAAGTGLSLRDPTAVLGDLGLDALLPLLRARSVTDVDTALDAWVEPVNNVVIADVHGRVRFRNAGRVPVRPEEVRRGVAAGRDGGAHGGWTGWLPLPAHDVPPDGEVVTANERRGPESDAIGTEFAPPHRADRIRALLAGRTGLTTDDFARIHADARAPVPERALLASLPAGPLRDTILAWDGDMAAGSAGAAAYAAWRSALTTLISAEPALAPLLDGGRHGPLFAPWLQLTASVGLALERLVEAGTPFGIDVRALAERALEVAEPAATWGATHTFAPLHAFDGADDDLDPPVLPVVPLAGDVDTVRCTGWLPGVTDAAFRGSVARYAWDLADRSRSGWVVPMGAAGDPRSPHHLDQLTAWQEGRLLPVETDWGQLSPEPVSGFSKNASA